MALRGDGDRRVQGRLLAGLGVLVLGTWAQHPHLTLGGGGQGTHSLTGTHSPPHARGLALKRAPSLCAGLILARFGPHKHSSFFGMPQAWGTPRHPTSLSRQDARAQPSPDPPSPVLSGGSPGRGDSGRALAAPWAGGTRREPVDTSTIPWAAREAAAELRGAGAEGPS